MKFLKKFSAIIVFVLTIVLDQQYNILNSFIKDPLIITAIHGIGALILAKFTNSNLTTKVGSIGGTTVPVKKDEK